MPAVHWGLGERIMSDPKRKFPVCEWMGDVRRKADICYA